MSKIFLEKNGEGAEEAAKRFFGSDQDCSEFINKKLKKGEYEFLACFAQAAVSKGGEYNLIDDGEKSYRILWGLMDESGVKEEERERLLLAVYKAPEKSMLRRWTDSADQYFAKKLYTNNAYAYTLLKKDTTGLTYPLILDMGKSKGEEYIIKSLLTFNVANRAKARRLIYGSKTALSLIPAYGEMSARERGEFVRLMLLDKRSHESVAFIKDVYFNEDSKRIVNVIENDIISPYGRDYIQPEYEEDEKSLYSPFVLNRRYKIRIRDFKVKKAVSQDPEVNALIKKRASVIKKELKQCKKQLFDIMVSGSRWAAEMFEIRLRKDKLFYFLCDKLYFALYNGDVFEDLVIISGGRILTAEGKEISTKNKQLTVAHPLMFRGRYAYLTMHNDVKQPFEQIKRRYFEPSESDNSFNYINRFKGSVITVAQLKKRMRGSGFHLKRTGNGGEFGWVTMLWQGVFCVAKLSEFDVNDPEAFVRAEKICFYDYKDVAKRIDNGSWENTKVMPISSLNPSLFSEFMLILSGIFGA